MADFEKEIKVEGLKVLSIEDMTGYDDTYVFHVDKLIKQLKDDKEVMQDFFSINVINLKIMLNSLKLGVKFKLLRGRLVKRGFTADELSIIFDNAEINITRTFCEKDSDRVAKDGTILGKYENNVYKTDITSVKLNPLSSEDYKELCSLISENNVAIAKIKNEGIDFSFDD